MKTINLILKICIVWIAMLAVAGHAAAQPAGVKKEDLRYDGASFDTWRVDAKRELKAEFRIEALRAMGMFGANGYHQEATETILEILSVHDLKQFDWADIRKTNVPSHRMVAMEAMLALANIGPRVYPVLLTRLDDEKTTYLLELARCSQDVFELAGLHTIDPTAVPLLVKAVKNDPKSRSLTIRMLVDFAFDEGAMEKEFLTALAKDEEAKDFCCAVYEGGRTSEWNAFALLERLGPKASPVVPLVVVDLKKCLKAITLNVSLSDERYSPPHFSEACIDLLNAIGPSAKEALPILESFAAQEATSWWVRDKARDAAAKIRGVDVKKKYSQISGE